MCTTYIYIYICLYVCVHSCSTRTSQKSNKFILNVSLHNMLLKSLFKCLNLYTCSMLYGHNCFLTTPFVFFFLLHTSMQTTTTTTHTPSTVPTIKTCSWGKLHCVACMAHSVQRKLKNIWDPASCAMKMWGLLILDCSSCVEHDRQNEDAQTIPW